MSVSDMMCVTSDCGLFGVHLSVAWELFNVLLGTYKHGVLPVLEP